MWGSPVELERKRRIDVAVAAYAYEVMSDPVIDDMTFDRECMLIDPKLSTGHKKLDKFFATEFAPYTGQWVHSHPDKAGLHRIYELKKAKKMEQQPVHLTAEQRKAIATSLIADIDAHTARKYDEGHRWHLGASQIGEECWRKIWYGFRWVKTQTFVDARGKDNEGRMRRLFNRGHKEEDRFVEWLTDLGFEVEQYEKTDENGKPKQFRISDVRGHFGGSTDGKITLTGKYAGLPKMLLEFKTCGSKYWGKLLEEGMRYAKPEHYRQMCSYAKRFDLRYGIYFSVNKDTDEIHVEVLDMDWQIADEMTIKAQQIIDAPLPPPRISDNSAFFKCKTCHFASVCHGQASYDKNCRSCVNAVAADNGEWGCRLFNQLIPREFVPQGCDQWREAK